MSRKPINLICCHGCGLIINLKGHDPNKSLHCYRCGTPLKKSTTINTSLIMAITSILLFIPSIYFPLLKISIYHFENQITLWDTIIALFKANYPFLGFAVALTILIIPLFYSLLIVTISSIKTNNKLARKILKTLHLIEQWHMIDVFLLGILVSIVKLIGNFDLEIGLGFYFLSALTITITLTKSTFDLPTAWEQLQ